eukprot:1292690-Prorocentrum_lima.AAC.1
MIDPKGMRTPFLVPEAEMDIEGGTGVAGAASSTRQVETEAGIPNEGPPPPPPADEEEGTTRMDTGAAAGSGGGGTG